MRAMEAVPLLLSLHLSATSAAALTRNSVNSWTGPDAAGVFTAGGGTVEGCTEDMDVFPEKGKVVFANFAVEYRNTYKIVTNRAAGVKYLLWQRGCRKPTDEQVGGYNQYAGVFEIPLRSVALTSASYFGAIEVMGERAAVRMVDSFKLYGSSPCMQKQHADGWTVLNNAWPAPMWDAESGFYTVAGDGSKQPDARLNALQIEATFHSTSTKAAPGLVQVSDLVENNFYAMGEWIEYHAFFFNREKEVASITDEARLRWQCHSGSFVCACACACARARARARARTCACVVYVCTTPYRVGHGSVCLCVTRKYHAVACVRYRTTPPRWRCP